MTITAWPGMPIYDVPAGTGFDIEKADEALQHLYDYKEIIPRETRSSTSAWTLTENDLNTIWFYSGATDVVWTIPDDINSNENGAKYLVVVQMGSGKVTLSFGSGFTGNIVKSSALTTMQTADAGRSLSALIFQSPANAAWVRSD